MRKRWTSDNRVVTIIERVSPNLHKLTCEVWNVEYTAPPEDGGTPIPTRLVAQYEMIGRYGEVADAERRFRTGVDVPRSLIQTYRES